MSKSLGNYIGIADAPDDMFGKIMSISDDLMWRYYNLLTDLTHSEIFDLQAKCESGAENPRNAKVNLAKLVIKDFHSPDAAKSAEEEFNRRFVKKEIPDEIEEASVSAGSYKLADLLVQTNLAASKGEARRLVEQGGVKIDGGKASNVQAEIELTPDKSFVVQVGKRRFLRVKGSKN
jgi:tyrosyl-tRNA synthetase